MAKKKATVPRGRKLFTFSLSIEVLEMARSINEGKLSKQALSRVVEEALADWIVKHGPKGKGAK
jgi:hypothetical protein